MKTHFWLSVLFLLCSLSAAFSQHPMLLFTNSDIDGLRYLHMQLFL
jgi:hypothetical protein